MQYDYVCKCGNRIVITREIANRDDEVLCVCGEKMARVFCSPPTSKLIGLKNSTQRDGVGSLIDIQGNVCAPITHGNKKTT